jgi:hypothetical protein
MNAVIAQHLNVAESAIVRVEEWANVIFAVVRGLGARFVSKRVTKMELTAEKLEAVGGSRWTKNGFDRVYFELADFVEMSNSVARKLAGTKLFWENGKFRYQSYSTRTTEIEQAIQNIKRQADGVVVAAKSNKPPFPNAMLTSTGQWVTPDQWDEIEGSR